MAPFNPAQYKKENVQLEIMELVAARDEFLKFQSTNPSAFQYSQPYVSIIDRRLHFLERHMLSVKPRFTSPYGL